MNPELGTRWAQTQRTLLDILVAKEELNSYRVVDLFTKETAQKRQEKLHFLAIKLKTTFLRTA